MFHFESYPTKFDWISNLDFDFIKFEFTFDMKLPHDMIRMGKVTSGSENNAGFEFHIPKNLFSYMDGG